ncbi:hypothetical protein GUA46_03960 [Muricauda sp. HICW]|uniref:Lipocalin-like domain-containing protein n=1 Tax=Flagellimonas chongwuensis TaxID=2697365 RepID=A0A850NJT4_9FLAO|nr:hypothetical protein [Allomuricauda chongwuensis]NVN17487.1 hypothetical protein [Allomuricauda chongwuensis]
MRNKKNYSLSIKSYLLAFLLVTFSCSNSEETNVPEETQESLIGIWKLYYSHLVDYNDEGEVIYDDKEFFDDTEYSTFEFKEDGIAIQTDYSNSEITEIEEIPYETVQDSLYIHWSASETEVSKYSIMEDELHLLHSNGNSDSNEEYTEVYKRQ